MWARHFEIFLGFWIAISWLIFSYPPNMFVFTYVDWLTCIVISVFSLGSYWKKFRLLHLLNFIVGCILVGIAFVNKDQAEQPLFQNYVVLGLVLLMFSIVPSHSSLPPTRWIKFLKEEQ